MEKDRRGKSGRSGEAGDKKDAPDEAVVILFDSRKPIEEFNSFMQQHIEGGNQAFLFLALSAGDLDGAKKLAESFKGENGIVSVKECPPINSAGNKGVVTLYRQNPSNVNNSSALEKARGMLKRLSSLK